MQIKTKDFFAGATVLEFIVLLYVGGQFEDGRIGAAVFLIKSALIFAVMAYSAYRAGAFDFESGEGDEIENTENQKEI